jgi:hypothetical protein
MRWLLRGWYRLTRSLSPTLAADLLSFMSCIKPKALPQSILPTAQPEARIVSAIDTLSKYAFVVRWGDKEVYDLHWLVHLATRFWVEKKGLAAEVAIKTIQHLTAAFSWDEYENRDLWREYLPHALKVLASKYGENSAERSDLCRKVGRCLQADGRFREAVRWFEETVRWTTDNLGEEDPSRLSSKHILAMAYQADGHVGKAVELPEHVVAMREKVLVEEDPH